MNEKWNLRRLMLAGCCLLALATAPGSAAARQIHGLVVGIDKYIHSPLKGAVNDARDINDALKSLEADVTLLLDDDANRDAIFGAWDAVVARSAPGDLIVFSYAGHGGQEPEAIPNSEEDHQDETFLLGGFDVKAPGNAQRIRDDEVYAMLRKASAQTVLFVADSCHSGTMTRAATRASVSGSRYMDYGAIVDDQLPPPPAAESRSLEGDLNHVMFFAGVADHLEVMEVKIGGSNRGALSYSVARALRGDADLDGDGGISREELETFVRSSMLSVTNGRQQVQVEGSSSRGDIIPPKPFTIAVTGTSAMGPTSEIKAALPASIEVITDSSASDAVLTWNIDKGEMIGQDGFVVHTLPKGTGRNEVGQASAAKTRSAVRAGTPLAADTAAPRWDTQLAGAIGVISKYMLADRLNRFVAARPLAVNLSPNAHVYRDSEQINLKVSPNVERYLTIFNIGPAGDINFLYPLTAFKDPPQIPEGRDHNVNIEIQSPFGAEHFIAITSREQPTHLQQLLQNADRQVLSPELSDKLAAEIRASASRIGVLQSITKSK